MDKLWAPWRIHYIKKLKTEKGCLFCRVRGSREDRKNLVVLRTKYSLALLNLYPYNNGHLMVVPYGHWGSLDAISDDESLAIMKDAQRVVRVLQGAFRAEGFNLGFNLGQIAGAGVADHVHLHVVPRWGGDTNFMSVIRKHLHERHELPISWIQRNF